MEMQNVFQEDEYEILLGRVMELLHRQMRKYSGCDSTSVTVDKARTLLESLMYTIETAMENGVSKDEILYGDVSEIIDKGQKTLFEKKKSAKFELKLLYDEKPDFGNIFFEDTLSNLFLFFKNYDIYYQAQDIPCSIDYWLLNPVPEEIKGISYIEEYIKRLQIENDFISSFDKTEAIEVYKDQKLSVREDFFNLCEPIMTSEVFKRIADERDGIISKKKTLDELKSRVNEIVTEICQEHGMTEKYEMDYFITGCKGMATRLYASFESNSPFFQKPPAM